MSEAREGNEISISMEAFTDAFHEEISSNYSFTTSAGCSIFEVPTIVTRHKESAYYPYTFSIGPFHYNKPPLMKTQQFKVKYLIDLISRSQKTLGHFTDAISEIKKQARESYDGPIEIGDEEFIKVMVLDGCFIVELFRKYDDERLRDRDDPIFTTSCVHQFLYHDLILLENQVPWLVLEILFDMTKTNTEKTLVQLAIVFFANIFADTPLPSTAVPDNHGSKHILDLLRNCLVSSSRIDEGERAWQLMPSATRIKDAGIKFKKCIVEKSILDIRFEKGILEMSPLFIQETTEPIFRNLIIFEQCCPNVASVITSYAILMDNLIKTREDVEILCQNGVIDNWLNVEDVRRLFNQLSYHTNIKDNFFVRLTTDVNRYCQGRWPRYRLFVMRLWALSIFVAICTFFQTVFAIIK
ncbi:hypothetical protein UlMin_013766 [Ulmus minor]